MNSTITHVAYIESQRETKSPGFYRKRKVIFSSDIVYLSGI